MDQRELEGKMSKFICHDIVSPLTNINTYVTLLKSDRLSPEEKEEILKNIENNSIWALKMISEMRQTIKKSPFLI